MNFKYIILSGGLLLTGNLPGVTAKTTSSVTRDSIGVENLDGKKVILYKIGARETYYSLSRKYPATAKDIMAINQQKKLRVGDVIKIPTGLPYQTPALNQLQTAATAGQDTSRSQAAQNTANSEFIEYKVGPKETLFSIAKRFDTTIEEIKKTNKLTGNGVKNGQVLKVPQGKKTPPPPPPVSVAAVVDTSAKPADEQLALPTDRYGLRQMTEQGVGVWVDDLAIADGKMLALHKTAPVGTVIKITNPMTNRTTYAKVVGKYNDTQDTHDAIIVISKAAASLIGVIDRRFQVTITYGVPNEQ